MTLFYLFVMNDKAFALVGFDACGRQLVDSFFGIDVKKCKGRAIGVL
jgi:hypothetical protein